MMLIGQSIDVFYIRMRNGLVGPLTYTIGHGNMAGKSHVVELFGVMIIHEALKITFSLYRLCIYLQNWLIYLQMNLSILKMLRKSGTGFLASIMDAVL